MATTLTASEARADLYRLINQRGNGPEPLTKSKRTLKW